MIGNTVAKKGNLQILAAQLTDLVKRANQGEEQALEKLRPLASELPAVFEKFGDLAMTVQMQLLQKITYNGKGLIMQEVVIKRMEQMRKELLGPTPSPLEGLLVERIMTCWLETQCYDYLFITLGNVSLAEAEYFQRRQDRAQKRYLSAIKTLAQVRRLAIPVVQVNIAGQQVNTQAVFVGEPEDK